MQTGVLTGLFTREREGGGKAGRAARPVPAGDAGPTLGCEVLPRHDLAGAQQHRAGLAVRAGA